VIENFSLKPRQLQETKSEISMYKNSTRPLEQQKSGPNLKLASSAVISPKLSPGTLAEKPTTPALSPKQEQILKVDD
jgi:hypothetical protein